MFSQPVLIAETDPHIFDILPPILSASIPQITIDVCTSVDDLTDKLKEVSYATIAMNLLFLEEYRLVKMRKPQLLLAPLLVIAHPEHRSLTEMALKSDAFDVIQSPIIPSEAAQSVRVAL